MDVRTDPGTRIAWRCALAYFGLIMITLTVFRLLFLGVYWGFFTQASAGGIVLAMLLGIGYDLYPAGCGLLFVLIFSHFPLLSRWRGFRWLWVSAVHAGFVAVLLLGFGNLMYYLNARKPVGYEAFHYLNRHMFPLILNAIHGTPVIYISALLILGLYVGLAIWVTRHMGIVAASAPTIRNQVLISPTGTALLVILLHYLLLPPFLFGEHMPTNHLAQNAVYSAVYSSFLGPWHTNFLSPKEVEVTTRQLLHQEPMSSGVKKIPRPYNVVILLMESWTGKYPGMVINRKPVTPVFDALAKEGMVFTRFLSTGYRSNTGIFSTITGFPDLPDKPMMWRHTPAHLATLPRVLKLHGYSNIFVIGEDLTFDNIDAFLKQEHFDTIVDIRDFKDQPYPQNDWGVHDPYVLDKAHSLFRSLKGKPFFSCFFSASTHYPYTVPDPKLAVFTSDDHPEYAYLNTYRYSDWAIGEFIKKARTEAYFANTIFVITADHTHHGPDLSVFENQHIPLLIYAPGIVPPGIQSGIGSHVDIAATLAHLLGVPNVATMGHDLLDFKRNPADYFAYWIAAESHIGWAEDDLMSVIGLSTFTPLLFRIENNGKSSTLLRDATYAKSVRHKALAYWQYARDILLPNHNAHAKVEDLAINMGPK